MLQGCSTPNRVDLPLLKAVARGRKWSQDLLAGRVPSVRALARREQVAARYVRELLPLGFLAPTIVEAIVAGRQPPDLTVIQLLRRLDLPLLWSAQEQVVGLRCDPS